jgi:feruloyl esterase
MWNQRALSDTPVSAEKIALVANAVMAKCDAVNGLKDGLIDDPRRCSFKVATDVAACPAGNDAATCLTPAQAAAIQKVYDGPTANGKQLFPGFMIGSEALAAGPNGAANSLWANLILPPAQAGAKAADFNLAEGTMRYLVFQPPQPDYDYKKFDFARDPPLLERWGKLANATDTNLKPFRARGGKLIMTYGWADTILQPMMGVNYYEAASKANAPNAPEFMRLFMVPGMAHCGGGDGTSTFDMIAAVDTWVETKAAPATIPASRVVDGQTVRTRPLCAYPAVATYKGSGSTDDAANFVCR